MKLTESSESNADAGNDFPLKSDDHESVPVEVQDRVEAVPHPGTEGSLKEGEIQDEKTLGLSSEKEGELVENGLKEGEIPDEKTLGVSSENGRDLFEVTHESVVSDAKWVSSSPNNGLASTASEWPSLNSNPYTYPYSPVGNEEAIVAVLHLQHNAIDVCQKFLAPEDGSDSDEDVVEDEDEDESEDELVENCDEESEHYKFFEKVFAEDAGLKKYYEDNCKKGDFYCLVCGGIKKKMWKRFKDCVALIQHSTTVLRTKRKRAHRAYAQVVCKVVGWDMNQISAIMLKDLDSSVAASKKLLAEPEKPVPVSGVDDQNAEPEKPAAVNGADDQNGKLVNSVDDN
ncbi:uncharacterized protein LOC131647793 [Vicia villosa]|uniref:uncharacterized protein LOC131647793 n=1 Tax=Vicia villosa TaxID=3911 RepID=UPI00273AD582|nr:uncharacterized protein LOC131647793 [Vicia villosa]